MKAVIKAALFAAALLSANFASAQQTQIQTALTVATRLDYRTAEFSWGVTGDDATLVGYFVQCGTKTGAYAIKSPLLAIDASGYLVSDVLKSNGMFYCTVAATDGRGILATSNEVGVQIKGRNVTVYE